MKISVLPMCTDKPYPAKIVFKDGNRSCIVEVSEVWDFLVSLDDGRSVLGNLGGPPSPEQVQQALEQFFSGEINPPCDEPLLR